jgi:CRISPR/Cas system-associated exonuclease Cas4 (RecB family)
MRVKEELEKGPVTAEYLSIKLEIPKERVENILDILKEMEYLIEEERPECREKGVYCTFCPLKEHCGENPIKTFRVRPKE